MWGISDYVWLYSAKSWCFLSPLRRRVLIVISCIEYFYFSYYLILQISSMRIYFSTFEHGNPVKQIRIRELHVVIDSKLYYYIRWLVDILLIHMVIIFYFAASVVCIRILSLSTFLIAICKMCNTHSSEGT